MFFYYIVMYAVTAFVMFAFADTLFLKAGLYDAAPIPDRVVFNKNDDRLFFDGGTSHIIGDQSSYVNTRGHFTNRLSNSNEDSSIAKRDSLFTRHEQNERNAFIDINI